MKYFDSFIAIYWVEVDSPHTAEPIRGQYSMGGTEYWWGISVNESQVVLQCLHITGVNHMAGWWMFIWAVSREKVPNVQKKDRRAWLRPPVFWYYFFWKCLIFFWKSRCRTKRPRAPVLLLVWQWLRTLGTFSHGRLVDVYLWAPYEDWYFRFQASLTQPGWLCCWTRKF